MSLAAHAAPIAAHAPIAPIAPRAALFAARARALSATGVQDADVPVPPSEPRAAGRAAVGLAPGEPRAELLGEAPLLRGGLVGLQLREHVVALRIQDGDFPMQHPVLAHALDMSGGSALQDAPEYV